MQSTSASGVPLPTTLSNVVALINGIPAPLLYVGPDRITGQIPYVAPIGPSQAAVMANGSSSQVIAFANTAAAPGIFTDSQNCLTQNQDQSLNTPNNPAAAGSTVTVYLTGIGPVDNPVPSGSATSSSPLSRAVLPAIAQLDGQSATLSSLGLVPGLVGVGQANLQIPLSAASGQRSLVITVGGVASNACPISVSNVNAAPPVISSLSPGSATAGVPALTLTVNGTGFVNGSTVQWSGSPLSTTFLSANQLGAAVPANLLSTPGSASVTVLNPGNISSNSVTFTIIAAPPVISSLSPSSFAPGSPALTLTVNGTGFVNGSTVQWNGSPLSTTFLSANQLAAAVPASLLSTAGSASVMVVNPGNLSSNAVTFSINAVSPVISSLSPSSATAGAPSLPLTVNGTGFISNSTVQWNGSSLSTTFVTTTALRATIPAGLLSSAGSASVTVVNPGGLVSNAMTFTINPNPTIQATTQACTIKGTVTGASPASVRVVVYALTNQYYIQPCYPGTVLFQVDQSGNFGPIASHSGSIYVLLVSPNYVPPGTTGTLPAVDHVNVFAVSGPVGTLSGCDVAACPAQ